MDAAAWDSPAAYVMFSALALVLVGLLVVGVASTPAHRLLGMHDRGPWWFSPAGGRTQGAAVAYLALLVAVAALVFVVADAYTGPALSWTLCWTAAALTLWATVTRFGRVALYLASDGRATWDDPLESDCVTPDDAGDDVDLRAARDATFVGRWEPAAHLLAATLDADARYDRVCELAEAASRDGRWLVAWETHDPTNPDALAVGVETRVVMAWQRRGYEYQADDVAGFLAGLRDADRAATAALAVAPGDASVLASRLTIARGLQLGHQEHARRLAQLRAVAPLHRGGLGQALQFLAPKWFGSDEQMFAFAREVAAAAPAGHAAGLLVVQAHLERYIALGSRRAGDRYMRAPEVRAELRAAAARWASPEPSPVGRTWGHNVLAVAFWLADLPDDAAPHLERTREHLCELPFGHFGDAREQHAHVQAWARARASRRS